MQFICITQSSGINACTVSDISRHCKFMPSSVENPRSVLGCICRKKRKNLMISPCGQSYMFRKLPNGHLWSIEHYQLIISRNSVISPFNAVKGPTPPKDDLTFITLWTSHVYKNNLGTGLVVAPICSNKKLWDIAHTFLKCMWLVSYGGLGLYDCLNSCHCGSVSILYSFNAVSGVNVTWRRIRVGGDPELLISSEVDLDGCVLAAVVSSSDANNEGLLSLVMRLSS